MHYVGLDHSAEARGSVVVFHGQHFIFDDPGHAENLARSLSIEHMDEVKATTEWWFYTNGMLTSSAAIDVVYCKGDLVE